MNDKELPFLVKIVWALVIMMIVLYFFTPYGTMALEYVRGTMHSSGSLTSIVFWTVMAVIFVPVIMNRREQAKKDDKPKDEKKS